MLHLQATAVLAVLVNMVFSEYDLVITNGICVTATDIAPLDIAIKGEKIALLAPSGSLAKAKSTKVVDAEGGYVMVSIEHQPVAFTPQ